MFTTKGVLMVKRSENFVVKIFKLTPLEIKNARNVSTVKTKMSPKKENV